MAAQLIHTCSQMIGPGLNTWPIWTNHMTTTYMATSKAGRKGEVSSCVFSFIEPPAGFLLCHWAELGLIRFAKGNRIIKTRLDWSWCISWAGLSTAWFLNKLWLLVPKKVVESLLYRQPIVSATCVFKRQGAWPASLRLHFHACPLWAGCTVFCLAYEIACHILTTRSPLLKLMSEFLILATKYIMPRTITETLWGIFVLQLSRTEFSRMFHN